MSCPYIGQKSFWAVQIVLEGYKLFLVGPIRFGQISTKNFGRGSN